VAVGVAQLIAGITGPEGSPVVAVGSLAIDSAPPAVKNFAITAFGSNDKLVLVSGILVVLAIFAAVVGAAAVRRLSRGLAGLGFFAAIGLIAAVTRPGWNAADMLPTLAGAAAGAVALRYLVRAAAPAAAGSQAAISAPARPAPPAPSAEPAGTEPGGGAPAGAEPPAGADRPDGGARPGLGGTAAPPRPPWSPGRAVPPRPSGPQRRRFLVAGATAAGTAAVAGLGGRLLSERSSVARAQAALHVPAPASPAAALPSGTDFQIPGLTPFITPNKSFYRVDTAIVLPEVAPESWSLRIHGMVRQEVVLSFKELLRRPLTEDYITLCCVSNPVDGPYIGNARWVGASLASLLRQAGIRAGADQLLCTSADRFTSGTPVQAVMDGRDAMLAIAMNGSALPVAHGFPARLVVPGLYAYVSACKCITDIEVTTFADSHAYWTVRGWDQQAPIKTESRIDIPTGNNPLKPGKVAVAGVAWAQRKGIAAVQVRVDNGPWHEARLAAVPGLDTWRQWVWEWDATPGRHVIQARATDKTGYTQAPAQAPPEPNGATGYPAASVVVTTA